LSAHSRTRFDGPCGNQAAKRIATLKPDDVDICEGRDGVEDMRRAVIEATLQGIAPF
jgi:nitric oxide reductase activation protein